MFNRYAFEIKNSCPAGQTIDHMSIWGFFAKNLSKTFNIFLSLKFKYIFFPAAEHEKKKPTTFSTFP